MSDLFTRLVSGPAAVPLVPRVPVPFESSYVDGEVDAMASSASASAVPMPSPAPPPASQPQPQPQPLAPAQPPAPPPAVVEVVSRAVRGEVAPRVEAASQAGLVPRAVDAVEPQPVEKPRDVVRMLRPRQPQSSKISAELRPREPSETAQAVQRQSVQRQAQREPARTTVRIEIGRIEIRAQRATPPPAQMPAAPMPQGPQGPSLADYLRGNDGRPR